ncbi:HPP family protein [Sphingomonas sp. 37zxx]|uniref:HPP family protein n=1 Tax=Sphingomonas sp. 37zxx TaxID=1550073 RepID=UPI00053C0305|nr:HPP family protein [Sphingomonas sp. 37zxx]
MNLFKPLLAGANFTDRLIGCVGATIGIALTIIVTGGLPLTTADFPLIVAPLGASAVLVFAVPSSPLAQPWPVVGGNVISSLIGVAAYKLIPEATIAAGVAVGAAILVMSLLRCLHPPGGAAALTAVIGSESIHLAGYGFAFAPVAINSIALVAVGLLFHRATARSYPHVPAPVPVSRLQHADIAAALGDMDESFDIAREDLEALLSHAERHAARREGKR